MTTTEYLRAVEAAFANNPWPNAPEQLYQPCSYIMSLGGKRIRPIALLMAYKLYRTDYERVMHAAIAMEVFHNFTLMHDDIMDQAALRRNQETVHIKYDTNTAILSGDVMLIHAYDLLLKCCDKKSYHGVMQTFNDVARGVCEGQRMDMDFELLPKVQLRTYIRMIELKTAVLLAGSLKIGALLGGAKATDAKHIYAFGCQAGIAFQILDDYLDAFGDQAAFGKTVGGDILQNKKTFLVLKAYEVMPKAAQKQLFNIMSAPNQLTPEQKIQEVKGLFKAHQIDQLALEAAKQYTQKAKESLHKVKVAPENKVELFNLLDELLGRNS